MVQLRFTCQNINIFPFPELKVEVFCSSILKCGTLLNLPIIVTIICYMSVFVLPPGEIKSTE